MSPTCAPEGTLIEGEYPELTDTELFTYVGASGASGTVLEKDCVVVPSELRALILNVLTPESMVDPVTAPVEEFKVMPFGNDPLNKLYVIGWVPVADTPSVYDPSQGISASVASVNVGARPKVNP